MITAIYATYVEAEDPLQALDLMIENLLKAKQSNNTDIIDLFLEDPRNPIADYTVNEEEPPF